jgi:hypothetical protein
MTVPRAMTAAIIGLPTKESEGGSFLAVSGRVERGLRSGNPAVCSGFFEALFRTRTGDPLLTMEVLYQLS